MVDIVTYSTFDGFRPHFDSLARVGYFKIVLKPLSPLKQSLHDAYKMIVWALIIGYNLQHVIRVIQVRHSTEKMVDTLFILLTTINTLGKQITFNFRSRRIDQIIAVINGPDFAPTKSYHVKVLKENAIAMSRLLAFYHTAVFTCGVLWAIFPIVNKSLGEEVEFTGYFPFDTTDTSTFAVALTYMTILITAQAYGNVTMDCTIVAFYAQAKTQIQMLRYNLEHLLDGNEDININSNAVRRATKHICYKDCVMRKGVDVQGRLINFVNHYEEIVRFTKEVESIFSEAMVVQFGMMAWVICMTMYKIVDLSILSAEFVSMAVYLGCMLAQLFIYCYYGTQLQVESGCINQSIYFSGWLALSPRFRRQLLIIMECCSRPLMPLTAYIVPMSLATYITVLKTSYTLLTFLNSSEK